MKVLVSFSGGETSAYMTWWLKKYGHLLGITEIIVVFANTGCEDEETLKFVKQCDDVFDFGTVWIEAVVHHNERRGNTHRIVDFETASRNGEPFEESIKKYGIPNLKFKGCTRDLKQKPIESYARSIGWTDHYTAIGIRCDEIDRMSKDKTKRRLIYPLATWEPTTKKQINAWWEFKAPFRLNLKHYQGNCIWCWKKTKRKHFTLLSENKSVFDFPERMESKYGKIGPEFKKPSTPDDYKRVFFRKNMSVLDIKKEYEKVKDTFIPYHDDAQIYDIEMDVGGGCGESCEVWTDDD